jgi:hypothetical protein
MKRACIMTYQEAENARVLVARISVATAGRPADEVHA